MPFTYDPEKSNVVLRETEAFFLKNPKIKEEIKDVGWIYQGIGDIIPQTIENFSSGHYFPYIESWEELQISFNLMVFGFYKQAFVSLRSSLELGLLSVYYNINDDGHKTVKDWLMSKDSWDSNTPKADRIQNILYSNANIKTFDQKLNLRERFNKLGLLHNYVHTKGYRYSNHLGILKSNFQTFQEKTLLEWLYVYREITTLVVTLHLLKYPIGAIKFDWSKKTGIDNPFPVLEKSQIEQIGKLLSKEYMMAIEKIADEDENTQHFYNYIKGLPDITKKEVELQILNLDKSMIEHGEGFFEWEKQQKDAIEKYSNKDKQRALRRIEKLGLMVKNRG